MRRLGTAIALALVLSVSLPAGADAASIERTWPVGNEPFGVTIDPADGRIYVANSDHGAANPGTLSVVDPAATCSPSTRCVSSIVLASPPVMSALDRGLHRLYVSTADRTLTFVDVATRSVVNTVPAVGFIGVAVDESTHHVYSTGASSFGVSSLSIVDGVTGSVLHSVAADPGDPGDKWWAVALDPGAGRVYVTNLDEAAPTLMVFDANDLSLIDQVPLPEVPRLALAVDSARQRVYVGGFSGVGRLYVVDANTRQITAAVDLQAGASLPFSATLVAAEDRLYLSQTSMFGPNSVVVLDLSTLQVVHRVPLPWQPGAAAVHPNGRLYLAGFSSDVLAAVHNSAPVVNSVALSPSVPRTNDTLTATATASDADSDPLTYTFTWKVDGVIRAVTSGANASSSFDLSISGNGDRGQTVVIEVSASDGLLQTAATSTSVVVANSPPTVTVTLSDSSPRTNDVLVATAHAEDADLDGLTVTYVWAVNGVTKQTGSSNVFDLGIKGNGDNRDIVSVTATASDGSASTAATATATVTQGRGK
jgi:hypothetical protein